MLGRFYDFILRTGNFFTSSESLTYVEDVRRPVTHNVENEWRQCKYPGNYDDVVKNGRIQRRKDSQNNPIPGEYELLFGDIDEEGKQKSFPLTLVIQTVEEDSSKEGVYHDIIYKDDNKRYFTIKELVGKDLTGQTNYSRFYEPFEFSKEYLEKYLPVFEVTDINADKKQGKDPIYELTNSSVATKKVNGQKVSDEKCRNGKLLYTSDSERVNIYFFAIYDEKGNLELAKSLFISVPIMFFTTLPKLFTEYVIAPFMKMGEWLMNRQNSVAQIFGRVLFTPAAIIKNTLNMGATILKTPVLLFTANEKKYGDAYYTRLKEQFKKCWNDLKRDCEVITSGKVPESEEEKGHTERYMIGTWEELNARKPGIQGEVEVSQETKDRSGSIEKLVSLEASNKHAQKLIESRERNASTISMK
ncbi:MAG TPA: hypothetical protein DEQ74_00980 [Wolbachia sp.]|uniref:hypothetical protein n=1 Tax=Wolbachia endosymbiont of Pentalonia nigronervosa TaxID=1301914 RepID=UPI000ED0EC66|nr:hypothetical protein [Wolbachia endosymbiont of Pentalonia nigronervosa]MBD0391099.1 hypothetical protein [Wolbachia endosymbiont of Pentalonia nigronervosa]HCE59398.1 hypothetical protein [Wolbachia sp.]